MVIDTAISMVLASPHSMSNDNMLPLSRTFMVLHCWPAVSLSLVSALTGSLASCAVIHSVVTAVLAGWAVSVPGFVFFPFPRSSWMGARGGGGKTQRGGQGAPPPPPARIFSLGIYS